MSPKEREEILAFATEFWSALGVELNREGRAFRVELPPELQEHFGKGSLKFALSAQDAWVAEAEILAPGSFLLEKMYEYIQDRGTRALFHLPAREAPGPGEVKKRVLAGLEFVNATVRSVVSSEAWPIRLAVDFKLVYQTDEIEEELVRVVEDEDGRIATTEVNPHRTWPGADLAPPEIGSRMDLRDLERRYDESVTVARRHATQQARRIEKASLERLAENLARIRGYFGQIRDEVGGDDGRKAERLRELDQEERLKTEEEVDSHRVRVRVVPVAMAVLGVPARRVTVKIAEKQGKAGAELQCDWDLSRSRLRLPADLGPAEGSRKVKLYLCREGHLLPAGMTRSCRECSRESCESHGIDCPGCGERVCATCGKRCALCERRFCPDHLPSGCESCDRPFCAECASTCVVCGVGSCRDCTERCGVCDAQACRRHVVTCGCGSVVCGNDVVTDDESGIRYCRRCASLCADCEKAVGKATSLICGSCGARLCKSDGRACRICRRGKKPGAEPLCAEHRVTCNSCGHDTCRSRHVKRCRLCACDVCVDCIESAGRCELCLKLYRAKRPVKKLPTGVPADLAKVSRWYRARGVTFDLLRAEASGKEALLVADKEGVVVKVVRK